jgi:hypothetical protein
MGWLAKHIILPLYLRIWIKIYKIQNFLFILYPTLFRKMMYLSHRLYHEYVFFWGRNKGKSKICNIKYKLFLGRGCVILCAISLLWDLLVLHSIHYLFYSLFFGHLYLKVTEYLQYLANCYEKVIER